MPSHTEQVDLPYSPRQVFDLVADIESYPRFLPSVISARIRRRNGDMLWVDQRVRFALFRVSIATRAVLQAPIRIHIVCQDNPLVRFKQIWTFADNLAGGTRLRSSTEYEFRAKLMRLALDATFKDLQRATMDAFATRARLLYGEGPPPR